MKVSSLISMPLNDRPSVNGIVLHEIMTRVSNYSEKRASGGCAYAGVPVRTGCGGVRVMGVRVCWRVGLGSRWLTFDTRGIL